MPTYPYICEDCNYEFEEEHSIVDEPLKTCPKCNKDTLKRLIYGGSGKGIVELYGQELKDQVFKEGRQLRTDAATKEKLCANLIGEEKYHKKLSEQEKIAKDFKHFHR